MSTHLNSIQKNDNLIRHLCKNQNYIIKESGEIITLVQATGRVSKKGIWRILVPDTVYDGYIRYRYQYVYLAAHRIMYQKFIGELDHRLQINHIDGNRKNNTPTNLELVSGSENQVHSYRVLGRKPNVPFTAKWRDQ